jgi:hypothetical protein
MKPSLIVGRRLPESAADLTELVKAGTQRVWLDCRVCGHGFNFGNTWTKAGWRETQVSKICENCFEEAVRPEVGDED